ncbi:MAG: glycosyltransferase [Pseudomonadota bacterium]
MSAFQLHELDSTADYASQAEFETTNDWVAADYVFLVPQLVDRPTFDWAVNEAIRVGASPDEILIRSGRLSQMEFNWAFRNAQANSIVTDSETTDDLATPHISSRMRFAASGIRRTAPHFSAATGLWSWQVAALVSVPGLLIGIGLVEPGLVAPAALGTLSVIFLIVVLLRLVAAVIVVAGPSDVDLLTRLRLSDEELPTYAVVVPLYREADIVADCISAMANVDYPTDKLDIVFAVEADDAATLDAFARVPLPLHMRIEVVAVGEPRTKPKALNYVLAGLSCEYVAVYDAEDLPEPDQLRKAAIRFSAGGANLGCLQAKLNIYNWDDCVITRQFCLEYSGLFDGFLRALEFAGLPIPLGGTSNHFPRSVLQAIGGWDAHNVTEDADLGLRLARLGYRVSVLDSTTWEEAPANAGVWLRQRTRWIKGWLQTYAVHMRQPFRLLRDLGFWRFAGLQAFVGGLLASAFLHPLVYILIALQVSGPDPFAIPSDPLSKTMWAIAAFNVGAGLISAAVLAGVSVVKRRRPKLLMSLLLMPVYWLAITIAAYRAAWHLWAKPFSWEKTPHRARTGQERRHPV